MKQIAALVCCLFATAASADIVSRPGSNLSFGDDGDFETNYDLVCRTRLVGQKQTPLDKPFVMKVRFDNTKTDIVFGPKPQDHHTYLNLKVTLGNGTYRGGQSYGSTYAASTTYEHLGEDGMFEGDIVWAFAAGYHAWNVKTAGTWYLCERIERDGVVEHPNP